VVKKRGKVTTSRARPAAVSTGSAPEVVTNAEEANRAWQALERERTAEAEPLKGKGALTLATDSTAKVYLGSRSLGETPLFRVPLRPGKHTLRLVAPGTRPLKLQVEIKAGEVTSLSVPFGDEPARE
jgi:serine/threonine-protein kinase